MAFLNDQQKFDLVINSKWKMLVSHYDSRFAVDGRYINFDGTGQSVDLIEIRDFSDNLLYTLENNGGAISIDLDSDPTSGNEITITFPYELVTEAGIVFSQPGQMLFGQAGQMKVIITVLNADNPPGAEFYLEVTGTGVIIQGGGRPGGTN